MSSRLILEAYTEPMSDAPSEIRQVLSRLSCKSNICRGPRLSNRGCRRQCANVRDRLSFRSSLIAAARNTLNQDDIFVGHNMWWCGNVEDICHVHSVYSKNVSMETIFREFSLQFLWVFRVHCLCFFQNWEFTDALYLLQSNR